MFFACHLLPQPYGHVLQHVSVQPTAAGLQSSSPPVVTVLQPPPEPPLAPDPAVEMPKLLMPPADMTQVVEEVTHSMSQNQAFMQHLQQVRASVNYLQTVFNNEMLMLTTPLLCDDDCV